MTEDNKGGFEAAPWEQKPQPKPQPPQQQPPQQGQPQYPQQQPPQQGYQQQQPPQQGYPQQPMPGQQAPQPPYPNAQGGPIPAGPYGNMPPHMGHRPMSAGTSTPAVVALVGFITAFILTGPLGALIGIIAGFVGLSDIKKTGKSGKGFALTGIIGGGIYMLIFVAVIGFMVFAVSEAQESMQEYSVALEDGNKIQKRAGIYYEGNDNSLEAGGLQVTSGYPTGNTVVGTLKVSDLVTSLDLVNPVESYRLMITGTYATIYYTDSDGSEISVGSFYPTRSYDNNYNENDYR